MKKLLVAVTLATAVGSPALAVEQRVGASAWRPIILERHHKHSQPPAAGSTFRTLKFRGPAPAPALE